MIKDSSIQTPDWLLTKAEDTQQAFAVVLSLINERQQTVIEHCVTQHGVELESHVVMASHSEFRFAALSQTAWTLFQALLSRAMDAGFDVAIVPIAQRKKQLLLCDMDSTIVSSETLDDIAAAIGIGEQVSQITAQAMRGELDFKQALDARVALLKGLPLTALTDVIESIALNPGAERLLTRCRQSGLRSVLVSGGFEPIVKHITEQLGFDRYVCNRMQVEEGKLSGRVQLPVVDSDTKLSVLKEECSKLNIKPEQACCIGDGANDLPMLQHAGFGIGFHAKPIVNKTITYQINHSGLDFALAMMGIAE